MKFALITGASSGIGKAFAMECASRGMHVLLVALEGKELEQTREEIRATFNVHCHSLGVDFSAQDASHRVYEWVKSNGYRVNVLINNVGVGSKGPFARISPEFYATQINLNVATTCILTRLMVDELSNNNPAYILNVGSMGGFFTLPEKTVYTATKAFVYAFSQGLRIELKDAGISVSVVCPGGTDSNAKTIAINKDLKGIAKSSILQPEQVAQEAIEKMLEGKATIIPGTINRFNYRLSRLVPRFVQNIFIGRAFRHVKKHGYST